MKIRTTTTAHHHDRDRGVMLPMVLVATVVFTIVGVAVAGLVATGLRYGGVVEDRADRLAAADGGLRYGIERLRNMEDLCSTALGTAGGYTTIFPPTINGAATSVTCRRVGADISDVQGWGVVITGSNVPGGQDIFLLNGSATTDTKSLRGPVFIADPHRLGFNAKLVIEDGDVWYTQPSCDPPAVIPEVASGDLIFQPSFLRGPQCNTKPWNEMFTPPSAETPTTAALQVPAAFDDGSFPGCRVFYPGRYSGAIPLTGDNYFRSGDYYFENVDFSLTHKKAVFGFPSGSGDIPRISPSPACQNAMYYDQNTSGERGGATVWAGGNTRFVVGTQAELEIFRRQQSEAYVSLWALDVNGVGSNGVPFIPSIHSFKKAPSVDWMLQNGGRQHQRRGVPRLVLGTTLEGPVGQRHERSGRSADRRCRDRPARRTGVQLGTGVRDRRRRHPDRDPLPARVDRCQGRPIDDDPGGRAVPARRPRAGGQLLAGRRLSRLRRRRRRGRRGQVP